MNQEEFTQNVVKEIDRQKLVPKPRWRFLLSDSVLWGAVGLSTLLGGLATATVIFMICEHDWDVYSYLGRSPLEHVLVSLPYLWLAVLTFSVILADYNFRYTRRGYRHEAYKVALASILGSLVLGGALFAVGIHSQFHETLSRQIPFYENLIYDKDDIWIYPEKGLLSGRITEAGVKNDGGYRFSLQDWQGRAWMVTTSGDTVWESHLSPRAGIEIKLIGSQQGGDSFSAKIVRPW